MATRKAKPVKPASKAATSSAAKKRSSPESATAHAAPATAVKSSRLAKRSSAASEPAPASDIIDQQLAKYRSMRDFGITAEPSGATAAPTPATGGTLPFCIQKHAASHLHYDFRLGWNGVLKSWAVAKGPSYFTGDKRLAVQVEDHPIDYGGFEGIIPRGQYGGGTVMLWDEGTWAPQPGHEDIDAGLRDGSLKFLLFGSKMHGKWTLIRMGGKAAQERKPNWLLIKEHDDQERPRDAPAVTEAEPNSVATGRTMEQIASEGDHVWNSKDTAKSEGRAWYRNDRTATPPRTPSAAPPPRVHAAALPVAVRRQLEDLPEEPQPEFLKPQLALEATAPPDTDGWLHELKLDGYRMQARKSARGVEMLTRSGLDWTYRIPAVAEAVGRLNVRACTLDGEVVVLRDDGTTNFADLQASFQEGARNPLTYFCFDLLHLEGRNPRELDLRARKDLLAAILVSGDGDTIRLGEHLESNGAELFHQACEAHAEGIVSKLATSHYRAGRSGDWLKSKCLREQEFVIGGFTLPSNGIHGIGALLLGYYRDRKLVYAGRTGTGFTQKTHRLVRDRLDNLRTDRSAFLNVPAPARRGVVWVRPELVAQVRFATWTAEDLVRQAAFLSLREDKPAKDVRREAPEVAPQPKRARLAAHPTPAAEKPTTLSVAEKVTRKTSASTPQPLARPTSSPDHAPVRLTHPAKLLDQQTGVTKQMLADFYWAVSEQMLPAIAGRPLSLVRCPEGSEKPCFYQKHVNHLLPAGVTAVDVPDKKTGQLEPYITLDTAEALAGLAQMGVLEVHPWSSRNADLEHPDRLIFDLDPDEALPWTTVTGAAFEIRDRLTSIHLESFVKTTGGKGLHIVVPLEPQLDWTQTKDLAHAFVREMERENPALYLTKMTKAARTNRIYLDYLRNERGATAVAPFSPRARAGLPVSLPLAWNELKTPDRPSFRVAGFASWRTRLSQNPWKKMAAVKQHIDL